MNWIQSLKSIFLRPAYTAILPILTLGRYVLCPICDGRFRRFQPYEGKPDFRCPACGSLPRHRLLWLFLHQRTDLFIRPYRMLHFAPESCLQDRFQRIATLDYLSADLNSSQAMVREDITRLSFPDRSFDVILCSHVLEHIEDDRRAMRELFRVLRPGGWALILVPIDSDRAETLEDPTITTPEQRQRVYHQFDHVRLYSLDIQQRLQQVGFQVRVEKFGADWSTHIATRYGIRKQIPLFYCLKS